MSKETWLSLQVLQPVCHTRALQLWTAVYLPTSSPCTAVDDSMELYLPPSAAGEELSSRSLDRCVPVVCDGGWEGPMVPDRRSLTGFVLSDFPRLAPWITCCQPLRTGCR